MAEAAEVIGGRFGPQYAVPKGRTFKTKTRNAQEAHEAIRPTSFGRDPDAVAKRLGNDEARLYRLIWQRAIASQMAAKEQETTTVDLAANGYDLRANATRTTFDGFSRVYTEGHDDVEEEAECALPPLVKGDATDVESVKPLQHFTEPPPRYTEATLIKALEEHGIGRPSTYAATISTIVDRGYVKVTERRLYPEPVGEVVTDLLVTHFGEFVDLEFTARMEDDLDEVASGKRSWVPVVREFYTPFRARIDEKTKELKRADFTTRPSDELCSEGPRDGHPAGPLRRVPGVLQLPGAQGDARTPRRRAAAPRQPAMVPTAPRVNRPRPKSAPSAARPRAGFWFSVAAGSGRSWDAARYPDCDYIKKEGPPPPPPLPFEVACSNLRQGSPGDAPRTPDGLRLLGLLQYPTCRYTTSHEPIGALHDADGGPVGRNAEAGLCLTCGAAVDLTGIDDFVGKRLAGGEPNPDALSKPSAGRGGRRTGSGAAASRTGARKPAAPRKTAARRAG